MSELTSRQVKRQLFWTTGCYRAALLEHYYGLLSEKEKKLNCQRLRRRIMEYDDEIDPEVHHLYIKKVLAMSTERLDLIVKAFQTGQQYRKQDTIDAIMTELFERAVSPETKE
jgi:hypothetical protein